MVDVVTDLLRGFERDGFRTAVLLSGHYPNRREYFDQAIRAYTDGGGSMRVIGLVETEVDGVGGDHAALYETSYMMHLHPDLVDLDELAGGDETDIGAPDERRNWMDSEYRDHPCYGIVGIDPRSRASAEIGRENTDRLLDHLAALVAGT
jgi:creatinine amidohydrolase/Fe(II)-dependent formamide hydrolase-like protein